MRQALFILTVMQVVLGTGCASSASKSSDAAAVPYDRDSLPKPEVDLSDGVDLEEAKAIALYTLLTQSRIGGSGLRGPDDRGDVWYFAIVAGTVANIKHELAIDKRTGQLTDLSAQNPPNELPKPQVPPFPSVKNRSEEECRNQKTAEPCATDNPDDAQRLREDH